MSRSRVLAFLVAIGALLTLPAPVTANEEATVRPGVPISVDGGGLCTLGFLFEGRSAEGEDAGHWAVTAGHCVPNPNQPGVWGDGSGPDVFLLDGSRIGEVRAAKLNGSQWLDVALIEIEVARQQIDPTVCYWGGPTGPHVERHSGEEDLVIFGNGLDLEPRWLQGIVMDEEFVGHRGLTHPGDSGAPVLSGDGRAIAVHYASGSSINSGRVWTGDAVRLDRQLEWLADNTGLQLELLEGEWRDAPWPFDIIEASDPGCPSL